MYYAADLRRKYGYRYLITSRLAVVWKLMEGLEVESVL